MRNFSLLQFIFVVISSLSLIACGDKNVSSSNNADPKTDNTQKVVVYSARAEYLIKPLFDAYTKKTGIKIEYITDQAGPLLTRLKSEGVTTPADILLTTDVGNLWQAEQQGVLQPITSDVLMKNIPVHLRDKYNHWFGLTQRARTIVYASDRVNIEELSTYEALADEKWSGRLCLRTSKKVYNQSLVASFIAHEGAEKAANVINGWVKNLAVAPFSDDMGAMEAIKSGLCDVTIVNTYYFGDLESKGLSGQLKIFWPNQNGATEVESRGVHMNISGAGVTRHAKHPEQALALIEWLSGEEAQGMLAGLNLEFPVNPSVSAVERVLAWGAFKADSIPLLQIANHQLEAVRMIDEAGYQ
jgi:iron(III) transport system substrate-binding protein